MRVVMTALAICALSFLTGVAGDLSAPRFAEASMPRAVVALPPHLENAVRAAPLPVSTSAAAAAPRVRRAPVEDVVAVVETASEKPAAVRQPKRAPKADPSQTKQQPRVKS